MPKFPKTFIGFIVTCVVICAVITLFKDQFGALADWLINPSAPDIGEVDLPGVK